VVHERFWPKLNYFLVFEFLKNIYLLFVSNFFNNYYEINQNMQVLLSFFEFKKKITYYLGQTFL
jgi:hypothetical protein